MTLRLLLVGAGLGMAFAAVGLAPTLPALTTPAPAPSAVPLGLRPGRSEAERALPDVAVEYRLLGTAREASVSFMVDSARGSLDGITPPARFTETAKPGEYLSIQGQAGFSGGEIEVQILVDGKDFARAKSSGRFAIASTNGRVPGKL